GLTENASHQATKNTKKHKENSTMSPPHHVIVSSPHPVILSSCHPPKLRPQRPLQAPIHQPSHKQQPEQWLQRSAALYPVGAVCDRTNSLTPDRPIHERSHPTNRLPAGFAYQTPIS